MPVDHAEVVRRLKGYIASKPSHGERDLLASIGRLESECSTDPDAYARFVARFGAELEEAFLNLVPSPDEDAHTGAGSPLSEVAASASVMAAPAPPSTGAERATEENTTCPPHPQTRSPRRPTASRAPALT